MTLPAGATTQGGVWGMGDGTGQAAVSSPLSRNTPPIARTLMVFPPEIFPIPDAQEFNVLGFKTSAMVESNVDLSPGARVRLPQGSIAIIRSLALYIDNMLTTTNVTWSLLLDGNPVAGYAGLSIFPRAAPSVSNTFDCFIRVPNATRITVVYTNNDGGTYIIGASFGGWQWPVASDDRWRGGGY